MKRDGPRSEVDDKGDFSVKITPVTCHISSKTQIAKSSTTRSRFCDGNMGNTMFLRVETWGRHYEYSAKARRAVE